ncbi:Protein yippee-like MOH1 [Thelohanellus kitauei]|uniref:Protein yippee-like n=1 Tax=Thelohanellus kitauei TaxID=669202 RepID=A0A0C2IJX3_THEKT|nr:Protein yippee-like MOH1 [Thelohanellus kitauei]
MTVKRCHPDSMRLSNYYSIGIPSIRHLDGNQTVKCATCRCPLTLIQNIRSGKFTGQTGSAYLVDGVINVIKGIRCHRRMMSGPHIVCDIFCHICRQRLGWYYEFAENPEQQYKEGKYVLEKSLIRFDTLEIGNFI